MSLFVESGVQVDLTGKPHFRFQDLESYRTIKGQHVQEMAYCWLDAEKPVMLELKAYSEEVEHAKQENTTVDEFIAYLIQKTTPKVWDSLLMFSACWLPTDKGLAFRNELDPTFHTHIQQIGIIIVLDVPDWFKPQFASLKKRFRTVLKGKMALFDIRSLIVCMPGQLKKTPFAAYLQSVGDT